MGCCLLTLLKGCSTKKPCRSFLVFSGAYMGALILLMVEKLKILLNSRSCFGCCGSPAVGSAMDGSSKALREEDREVKKQNLPENFRSSSTHEMDKSTVLSQRSISSVQSHDSPNDAGNNTDFVNSGLLLWNETRKQWIGNKMSERQKQVLEPKISWNATYESLLGTSKPFPEPVPLAEMIDFLIDVWEQEGLYE